MIKKIIRALFCWRFVPATDMQMRAAQLIVTQAWSRRSDQGPGKGNEILAKTATDLHTKYGIPVFAQEEVAWAMSSVGLAGVAGGSPKGASNLDWNTYTVALIQARYCWKHRIDRLIVVAHPLHMGRALWSYRRLGFYAFPAPMPKKLSDYQDEGLIHLGFSRPLLIPVCWFRELCARVVFVIQDRN